MADSPRPPSRGTTETAALVAVSEKWSQSLFVQSCESHKYSDVGHQAWCEPNNNQPIHRAFSFSHVKGWGGGLQRTHVLGNLTHPGYYGLSDKLVLLDGTALVNKQQGFY